MTRTGWQNPWVRIITTVLTVAVMVMIFCFSMENAEKSDMRSGSITIQIIKIFHPDYEQIESGEQQVIFDRMQHIVRKCAHFTEYMMLGFLLRLCVESWIGHRIKKRWTAPLIGLGAGAIYACTDEIHQLAIDGRSGQWTDVLVDSCGVLAGVTLGTFLIRSLSRKNADNP